jgi:hypothetical protein
VRRHRQCQHQRASCATAYPWHCPWPLPWCLHGSVKHAALPWPLSWPPAREWRQCWMSGEHSIGAPLSLVLLQLQLSWLVAFGSAICIADCVSQSRQQHAAGALVPVDAARVVDLWICCFKAAVGRPCPLCFQLITALARSPPPGRCIPQPGSGIRPLLNFHLWCSTAFAEPPPHRPRPVVPAWPP